MRWAVWQIQGRDREFRREESKERRRVRDGGPCGIIAMSRGQLLPVQVVILEYL